MEEKNNKLKKKIILVAVVILTIIIIGICVYVFFIKDKDLKSESSDNENIEQEIVVNTEEQVEKENVETEEVKEEENKKEQNDSEDKENKTESAKKEEAKIPQPTIEPSKQENQSNAPTTAPTYNPEDEINYELADVEVVKELTNTVTKYGVVINTYTITTYNVYTNGIKTVNNTITKTEYDRTNYSATTSELLAEARSARSTYAGMISQVANNVNTYRAEANTNSIDEITTRTNLVLDEQLCIAANVRAVEMAYSAKISHTRPNGSSCYTVINEMGIGYMTAGENIASGYGSANSVSLGWKNSPGHYSNMISEDFAKIGVGVYKLDGTYYWVQLFTN